MNEQMRRATLAIAVACLACISGCGRPLPERLNIVDFTTPRGQIWEPRDLFADPQVISLAVAVKNGDLHEIDRLLSAGVDVNAKGKDDITPLGWAMMIRNKAAFRHLLERGANPNQRVLPGMTGALNVTDVAARIDDDSEWLDIVLQHGGDPNVSTDPDGETPIFTVLNQFFDSNAVKKKKIDLLIKAGADLNHQNAKGITPLMWAVRWNQCDIGYSFLEAGADFRIKDTQGRDLGYSVICCWPPTPMEWREKVIDFLEKRGFSFDVGETFAASQDREALARWEAYKKKKVAKAQ